MRPVKLSGHWNKKHDNLKDKPLTFFEAKKKELELSQKTVKKMAITYNGKVCEFSQYCILLTWKQKYQQYRRKPNLPRHRRVDEVGQSEIEMPRRQRSLDSVRETLSWPRRSSGS